MKILAVDTATEACSAALLVDSEIVQKFEIAPRKHADLILNMIDQLLAEAQISLGQLDGIAFGRGPGAFTGVRIATGITQGLAYAADLPVIPISNLGALAQAVIKNGSRNIFSAIDARMKEIYWCIYQVSSNGIVQQVMDESISLPSRINVPDQYAHQIYGVGSGWKTYRPALIEALKNDLSGYDDLALPQSRYILELARHEFGKGNYFGVDSILPVYLRNNVTG
jgi:tRNA threonylcarbamoyladenosine biosynthesis protein TsaB